jgi:hypothetical protein
MKAGETGAVPVSPAVLLWRLGDLASKNPLLISPSPNGGEGWGEGGNYLSGSKTTAGFKKLTKVVENNK